MAENQTFTFETFDEYKAFLREEGRNMPHWSREKGVEFTEHMLELLKNPEFKEKYDEFMAKVEEKAKRPKPIMLSGNPEKDREAVTILHGRQKLKALAARKRKQTQEQGNTPQEQENSSQEKPRIVLGGDPKQNKAVLKALASKSKKPLSI